MRNVIYRARRASPSSANIPEQIGSIQLLGFPSERYPKMKIKSEKQFSKLHEPSAEGGSSRLPFDPEKYRKYLAETGWSEKVQDECLETVWNMMSTFVDLAWGTDSVQAVLKTERPSSPENLQPEAQKTSNPRNVSESSKKTGKRRRI
jgi:hypothetical protein